MKVINELHVQALLIPAGVLFGTKWGGVAPWSVALNDVRPDDGHFINTIGSFDRPVLCLNLGDGAWMTLSQSFFSGTILVCAADPTTPVATTTKLFSMLTERSGIEVRLWKDQVMRWLDLDSGVHLALTDQPILNPGLSLDADDEHLSLDTEELDSLDGMWQTASPSSGQFVSPADGAACFLWVDSTNAPYYADLENSWNDATIETSDKVRQRVLTSGEQTYASHDGGSIIVMTPKQDSPEDVVGTVRPVSSIREATIQGYEYEYVHFEVATSEFEGDVNVPYTMAKEASVTRAACTATATAIAAAADSTPGLDYFHLMQIYYVDPASARIGGAEFGVRPYTVSRQDHGMLIVITVLRTKQFSRIDPDTEEEITYNGPDIFVNPVGLPEGTKILWRKINSDDTNTVYQHVVHETEPFNLGEKIDLAHAITGSEMVSSVVSFLLPVPRSTGVEVRRDVGVYDHWVDAKYLGYDVVFTLV